MFLPRYFAWYNRYHESIPGAKNHILITSINIYQAFASCTNDLSDKNKIFSPQYFVASYYRNATNTAAPET